MLLRGILFQTFLVIIDSFFMGTLEQAVSNFRFDPPSSAQAPTTVSVGSSIQCMADGKPTPIIKWYDTYGDLMSRSNELIVTENMRHWKQPIILHCLAFTDSWYPKVKGIYTFQVIGALSSGGDAAGEISFQPPSIIDEPTTVKVGDIIQCMANGISSPTIKWYDYNWNEVSGWWGLNVTEEMRHWRQPITFHCRAHNWLVFPGIEGSYTLQVAGAVFGGGRDSVKATGGYFSPYCHSKHVAVGTKIRNIRTVLFKSSFKISGQVERAVRWYDTKWNELSVWGGLIVTEEMRHWEQPITLHYKMYNGLDNPAFEGSYQFQVGGVVGGVEAWVIAVAVIVPIVVIAAIAIAVFFVLRRREMEKMSTTKTKPTNGSTAALLFKMYRHRWPQKTSPSGWIRSLL